MAFAWRLVDPRYANDLEGSGNRIHGARWNSAGRGVLYCSENLSLCVLENLVHLPTVMRDHLPQRVALRIEYPDDAAMLEITTMPKLTRKAGDKWLDEGRALLLTAPSIVVPQEKNIMFNPVHPEMKRVRVIEIMNFMFDDRLKAS